MRIQILILGFKGLTSPPKRSQNLLHWRLVPIPLIVSEVWSFGFHYKELLNHWLQFSCFTKTNWKFGMQPTMQMQPIDPRVNTVIKIHTNNNHYYIQWSWIRKQARQGSKLRKSSDHHLATNWRNIVARCKFLVAILYNVNDTAYSRVRSIRFDCLKISRTEVGMNIMEVNWLCL